MLSRRSFLGRLAAMGIAVKTIDGDALTAAFQETPAPIGTGLFAPGGFCPPGTYVSFDQGTLDLGIVRDSVLNKSNDYQLFTETFESTVSPWISVLESRLNAPPTRSPPRHSLGGRRLI